MLLFLFYIKRINANTISINPESQERFKSTFSINFLPIRTPTKRQQVPITKDSIMTCK